MQFVSKLGNFFGINDESYMESADPYQEPQNNSTPNRNKNQQSMKKSRQNQRPAATHQKTAIAAEPKKTQKQQALRPQAPTKNTYTQRVEKEEYKEPVQREIQQPQKVVNMRQQVAPVNQKVSRDTTKKIMIVEPRAYSEAMSIAKHVIGGESVLVNFHLLEESQARRIVDFLTGAVYAEDGDIKRVADEIFLCTPNGVEIDGTAQSLADSHMFDY